MPMAVVLVEQFPTPNVTSHRSGPIALPSPLPRCFAHLTGLSAFQIEIYRFDEACGLSTAPAPNPAPRRYIGLRFLAPSRCIGGRNVLVGIQVAARDVLAVPRIVPQSAHGPPPDGSAKLAHP